MQIQRAGITGCSIYWQEPRVCVDWCSCWSLVVGGVATVIKNVA